jgi:hypothetical protein
MDAAVIEGKISFVQHDKEYVTIEYTLNGKKKTVNGKVDEAIQLKLIEEKLIKKIHRFHEGDEVYFTLVRSPRGDKMVAERIIYRYNNALGNLINRTTTENKFTGYLKLVDDKYFVKETGSYLFFPVMLSPWEIPPDAKMLNEPVFFRLENMANPEKVAAALLMQRFIPEFLTAKKYYSAKKPIEAAVYKISPHSIYVNVVGDKIQAKIPLEKDKENKLSMRQLKVNDTIKITITYLSDTRIVVSPV